MSDLAERLRASTNYDDRSDAADLIEAQTARIAKMTEVMELALRYFENRIDVNDGDYGVSEANREMVLYNHMKKVLDNE